MKNVVVYSTRTGNTKKVAEAIACAIPGEVEIYEAKEAPKDFSAYDVVFVGFWADRGNANEESAKILKNLHHDKVAIFGTCGAYGDSQHAKDCLAAASALVPEGTHVESTWICQGKVDPELVKAMAAMFPEGHPHSMTPERIARLKEAEKHPSAEDLKSAAAWGLEVVEGKAE